MARTATYLDRYPVVHTDDREVAREALQSAYGISGFEALDTGFGIRANLVRLTSVGLAFCGYESAASLEFPEGPIIRQFFSIQGSASYTTATKTQPIGASSPLVHGASKLRLDFQQGYRQLVVRVDANALERLLRVTLGDASDRRLVFSGDVPNSRQMPLLRQAVFHLADELERFGLDYSPVTMAELERGLLMRFLLAHQHNFSEHFQQQPMRANRATIDIAQSFLETNWHKPLDIEELSRIANVSIRTLFREFALAGRGSPAQFLKQVRLERAAEFLSCPDQSTTVTGVALKCGFQNLGRFSFDYAQMSGELPSETLKRARGP